MASYKYNPATGLCNMHTHFRRTVLYRTVLGKNGTVFFCPFDLKKNNRHYDSCNYLKLHEKCAIL
jgi:hypothetical protein